MNMDRVKYYESNDYAFGLNLDKISSLDIPSYTELSVNDAIEFYEIKKYFSHGVRSRDWTDDEYEKYREKSKILAGFTTRFFSSLTDDTVVQTCEEVDFGYREVFWELFEQCKLYRRISEKTFERLIHSDYVAPFDLFRYRNTVATYGNILRSYILENEECISIVLHWYEQNFDKKEKLYRPKEFTGEDICKYFLSYIDGSHPSLNSLETIRLMTPISNFPINDEIRLKAKRKYQAECERLSKIGVSYEYGIQLSFSTEQEEEKKAELKGNTSVFSYSTKWLLDTLDYPSILNNFIYIFEYVDVPQMRCSHVSKESQAGIIERTMHGKSSRIYPCYTGFNFVNELASIQMNAYYNFLNAQGIRLEDVLEDFFTKYLQREFNCSEMRVQFPSNGTKYSEKCAIVALAFESLLRQFKLYVEEGTIDFELVSMSTTPVLFADIPSQVPQKYVYGTGKEFQQLTFLLFSDQCLYTYVPRIHEAGKSYKCLYDLLKNEQINLSDYRELEHTSFKYLAEYDLIKISNCGEIELKDFSKIMILKDLFVNEVISRWHYPNQVQTILDDWIEKGILREKSSLFSDSEVNYLNYTLNRSEYNNGLELRNKYLHGIQQVNLNEDDHKCNYFTLLRLFVLLAIKLNDDFILMEITPGKDEC